MSKSNKSSQSKRSASSSSSDIGGHESPKKAKLEAPATPEQHRAPNTPKSDFHKYAESILSPIGIETPGASFTPNLLSAPTSRDWSPYVQQPQGASSRHAGFDYFGFGDMSSSQSQKLKTNKITSPQFDGMDDSMFDPSGMDIYGHARSSSSTDVHTAHLLLSPGFAFDDMINPNTPNMSEAERMHRIAMAPAPTSDSKGMNLFGSATDAVSQNKKSSSNQRKRSYKKKSQFDDGEDDVEVEGRGSLLPTSPGLAAITAAAKKLERQSNASRGGGRSRVKSSSSSRDSKGGNSCSDSEELGDDERSMAHSSRGGRPPLHLSRPPQSPPSRSQDEDDEGNESLEDGGAGGGFAPIAPRSSNKGKEEAKSDNGHHMIRVEPHATPESLANATHPNMSPDPKNTAPCNCKKSRCLKLYCDCFRAQRYCSGCHCKSCANLEAHESERIAARNAITERNPEAFKPRIALYGAVQSRERDTTLAASRALAGLPVSGDRVFGQHQSGCHCKKSACLKKYCECFQAGVPCLDRCRCLDCKNTAENLATGFSNISKGGGSVGGAVSTTTSSVPSYPLDSIKSLNAASADGLSGGRISLLSSCFPDSDIPDDRPIYNKAQAEQAAFEIVSAFLRGEITVPGLESLSAGRLKIPTIPSKQAGDVQTLLPPAAGAVNGSCAPLERDGEGSDIPSSSSSGQYLGGDKSLSANSSLVQRVDPQPTASSGEDSTDRTPASVSVGGSSAS